MSIIPQGARCLTPTKVRQKLCKGNTWLWDRVKNDPDFPKPIYLAPRSPVFIEQQIDAYLSRLAEQRNV